MSVAEEGSFSKAGALHYITPSAVIQKINHLERELSVSLFERTNHGVRLTEAGRISRRRPENISWKGSGSRLS